MKTSSFLAQLRARPGLPLVFQAGPRIVSPGYHLTEVKDVTYRSMDCGAMTHRWIETHFEVWVPASAAQESGRGHMAAAKFLRIVDRVEKDVALDPDSEAKIFAAFGDLPAALHSIEDVTETDGQLLISLRPEPTRCKAQERRANGDSCGCGTKAPAETAAPAACCA